jgi:hypothetical protein
MASTDDSCETCPNRDSCSERVLSSEAYDQAYHSTTTLLESLLDGTQDTQGFITRAGSSEEAREVFLSVVRGVLNAVVEAYQDESFQSHDVMLDVAVELSKAYGEENEADENSEPLLIEVGGVPDLDSN